MTEIEDLELELAQCNDLREQNSYLHRTLQEKQDEVGIANTSATLNYSVVYVS